MMHMETRMERFARYREEIKRMAPERFPTRKESEGEFESAKEATLPQHFSPGDEEGRESKSGPYYLYLRRRKKMFAVKIIALILVVAVFAIWWFLLQGRK